MTIDMQRKFILGDEWAYFKIYSGPKTLEFILINEIRITVEELYKKNIIDKFFFIRYVDPDYHLRLRFHLNDITQLYLIIQALNNDLKYYIEKNLVWKVCTDTYNQELERYGKNTTRQMETLFSLDSLAIMNYLKDMDNNENDSMRWLWGIKCMDLFLEKFGLVLADKIKLFEMICNAHSQEFNMNESLKIQLDKKYRSEMGQINQIIDFKNENEFSGINNIRLYMQNSEAVIQKILTILKNENLETSLNSLLVSIIHMHFNRLFRTKQRVHEMIIYYFMHKIYKSMAGRIKYNPSEKAIVS